VPHAAGDHRRRKGLAGVVETVLPIAGVEVQDAALAVVGADGVQFGVRHKSGVAGVVAGQAEIEPPGQTVAVLHLSGELVAVVHLVAKVADQAHGGAFRVRGGLYCVNCPGFMTGKFLDNYVVPFLAVDK
jgi:hypothetical protein